MRLASLRNLPNPAALLGAAILVALTGQIAWCRTTEDVETVLRRRFAPELENLARNRNPNRSLPYWLAFSAYSTADTENARQYAANLVEALRLQRQDIRRVAMTLGQGRMGLPPPDSSLSASAALRVLESNLLRSCRYCTTSEQKEEYRRAAKAFLEVFDLRGVSSEFSGLPFYSLAGQRFGQEKFQRRTQELHRALLDLYERMARDPSLRAGTNLLEIATQVCEGRRSEAFELVGLLLSRDTNALKYFNHFPYGGPAFAQGVGEIPVLVLSIAELDRVAGSTLLDSFSYDGIYRTKNVKNYYFWSAGLVSMRLREQGFSEKAIRALVMEFPRQYKLFGRVEYGARRFTAALRRLEFQEVDADFFRRDAEQVMRNSASGARSAARVSGRGKACAVPLREAVLGASGR